MAVHVGQAEVAALVGECELLAVYAHEVQDRGLQVVDVDGSFSEPVLRVADRVAASVGDVVSMVVSSAVGRSGVAAAAGQSYANAASMRSQM